MKVVYIAGPYRSDTEWGVFQNIRRAEAVALEVWQAGAIALCPQKNTEMFGGAADDSVWLAGDLELLRRCDAVITVDGWKSSQGACDEVKLAIELGIPIFHEMRGLKDWLNFHQ